MKFKFMTCTLILLALSITAQAEPLDVKPGLWELTTVTEKKNANKPTNLDKLNPEQRDKVEKKLAEQAKKETKTAQACLREEQIKSGEVFIGKTHQANCKRTFLTQTPTDLAATLECSGVNKMSGDVAMHADNPEHLSGTVKMLYGNKGEMQMLTDSTITARWIGSDCSKITTTP
jgi:hypothetical protein